MNNGSVGIVILAAGESVRMGEPKQLLVYRGRTLLRHAAETALAVPQTPVVVVLGAHADQLHAELDSLPVSVVMNPEWQGGMGFSLRAGLRALVTDHPATAAAIFMLCDQPHVSPDLLQRLADEWRNGAQMAASQYETRLGVPAIFSAALFPELLALQGAEGARQVLARHADTVRAILFPPGGIDVDTPADYAALLRNASRPDA
jgi:molybdenum cofactor cytidylyltransferase